MGARVPLREHLPDGEVHWPDTDDPDPDDPVPEGRARDRGRGAAPPWAGECWAIEAELTRKTVRRTAAIMAEILTRTGDYGGPAAEVRVPGALPRHARVLYLCSPAARPTVIRARADLTGALAARVEIRGLPAGAGLSDGTPLTTRPVGDWPASSRASRTRSRGTPRNRGTPQDRSTPRDCGTPRDQGAAT
jgi:hypothetical protein